MNFCVLKVLAMVMLCVGFVSSESVCAQELQHTPEMLQAAEQQLMSTLDKVQGLLYKREKLDDGSSRFLVAFDSEGETTKFVFLVRYVGFYAKKPLHTVMIYSVVAENATSYPPAVIKMVAVKSDNCNTGGMLMSDSFDKVYLATKMPCDNLTEGQFWITLALMHDMRISTKKEIEGIMGAASK